MAAHVESIDYVQMEQNTQAKYEKALRCRLITIIFLIILTVGVGVAFVIYAANNNNNNNDSSSDCSIIGEDLIIGILRLDYDYPAQLGDVDYPGSYKYKTKQIVVGNLTFAMAQAGTPLTNNIKRNLADALKEFRATPNVVGIIGDCGFMLNYQNDVLLENEQINGSIIPIGMSSLIMTSTILTTINKDQQILIVTADADSLSPSFPGLMEKYQYLNSSIVDERFVIVGGENVTGFGKEIQAGDKINITQATPGFIDLVNNTINDENNNIGAILLECTQLPIFGDDFKEVFGLPVWDAITLANFLHAGSTLQFTESE